MSTNWVQPDQALWSFDIRQQEWQHRQPSGSLPPPEFCCGMCVIEDQAFVLVNPPSNTNTTGHMDVYVLDLQAWHWTRLPAQIDAPPRHTNFTPVVVQVNKHHAVCHHPSCSPPTACPQVTIAAAQCPAQRLLVVL